MRSVALRLSLAALASVLVLGAGTAQADVQIRTVVSLDPTQGGFPEGTVADVRGDVYLSRTSPANEILRVTPDGGTSVVAHFDVGGFGPVGMAVDASGRLYVAIASFDPATRGIYRVWPDGSSARLPGTRRMLFPKRHRARPRRDGVRDGLHPGSRVSSRPGRNRDGLAEGPAARRERLVRFGFPIGANGIQVGHRHTVFVSDTEAARIVTIGVGRDGSAGPV